MDTLEANVGVLLREKDTGNDWLEGVTHRSDETEISVLLKEFPNWLEIGSVVEAIHVGPDRNSTFFSKVSNVDRRRKLTTMQRPTIVTEVDRRENKRILTEQFLEWSPLGEGSDPTVSRPGMTEDISVNGVRFHSVEAPEEGQKIVLAVLLPIGSVTAFARCVGTQSSNRSDYHRISRLEFVWTHSLSQQRLKDWVDQSFDRADKMIAEASAVGKGHDVVIDLIAKTQQRKSYKKL